MGTHMGKFERTVKEGATKEGIAGAGVFGKHLDEEGGGGTEEMKQRNE